MSKTNRNTSDIVDAMRAAARDMGGRPVTVEAFPDEFGSLVSLLDGLLPGKTHQAWCQKAGEPLRVYEPCCQSADAPTPRETGACQYDCDRPYATAIACGMERAESDRSWGRDTACGCSCHAVDNKTLLAMYEDQRSMEHAHKTSKLASHTRLAEIANATEQHILQRLDTAAAPRPDAASASVTEAWQPIETVPKDGTRILVSFGEAGVWQVAWVSPHWGDEGEETWCVDDNKHGPYPLRGWGYQDGSCNPTHWMPTAALAAAPRDAGREEVSDAEVEAADKSWLSDASDSLWAAIRGKKRLPSDDEVNRDRRARMKRALEAARAARREATG